MPSDNNGKGKIVLTIKGDVVGVFIKRLNRFLATVKIGKDIHYVHVHDPSRLGELLYPGNKVLLKKYSKKHRKTAWELIAAKYKERWVFTNSKFHRLISERILQDNEISPLGKLDEIRPEVTIGKSRIDYLAIKNGRKVWIEIKGCTLEKNSIALFPDAPTERGRRHLEELIKLKNSGDEAIIIFLVFVKALCFAPNNATDPKFAKIFLKALKNRVGVYPLLLDYNGFEIKFYGLLKLCNYEKMYENLMPRQLSYPQKKF